MTQNIERLTEAAIIRGGTTHAGWRSHGEIRCSLDDEYPYEQRRRPEDTEGFMTSHGRFVSREDAVQIGVASGQLNQQWLKVGRPLLSSDVW